MQISNREQIFVVVATLGSIHAVHTIFNTTDAKINELCQTEFELMDADVKKLCYDKAKILIWQHAKLGIIGASLFIWKAMKWRNDYNLYQANKALANPRPIVATTAFKKLRVKGRRW